MSGAVGQWASRMALRTAITVLLLAHYPTIPLSAQVDPTGHWRTLETAHFNIHVRAEYRSLGDQVAGEAEAAYAELEALLPAPHRRVELVVADNYDFSNGLATTYPLPRIIIYAIPPAGDIQLESYDRWLRLVITHELTHVFHLDLARGWWRLGRAVLGRAPFLFPNNYVPAWTREGLAVFYESRLTAAGRLEGAFHRAVVDAAGAETGGMPLGEASTASPKWPGGLRQYAFGATFLGDAAARSGDSAIARFALITASRLIPYVQLSSAFKRATGMGIGAAWRLWQDSMDAQTRGRADARMLIDKLRTVVPPRVSPDGKSLLIDFYDGRDAEYAEVVDIATGARRRLVRVNAANGISWTADGDVVYAQLEFTDRYTVRSDLWRRHANGRTERLTHGQRLLEPDVAVDGKIVSVRVVPGGNELVEDGRTIVRAEQGVEWATPRFAPSGRFIAAVRVEGGWHDIVLLDRDGSSVRHVTHDSVPDLMPAFSPDGRWLMWSREVFGVPQIVGVPIDSAGVPGEWHIWTTEPFAAYAPAPTNDSIYYIAYHADGFRLMGAALGGQPTYLLLEGTVRQPSPRPEAAIVREHDYHALPAALPQYWLPQLFVANGAAWVGILTTGEDPLGRHSYFASLMAGFGNTARQWRGSFSYVRAGPGHAALDLSASRNPGVFRSTSGPTAGALQCCSDDDAADLGISLLRRRWRSQALVRVGVEYGRDGYTERAGGSISGSWARYDQPALAISAQDGMRISGTLRYRHRLIGDSSSMEMTLRGSAYRSIAWPLFARQVLAARVAVGVLTGGDPIEFSVGGVSSGSFELLPGLPIGGSTRTFPVRGFAPGSLGGRRAASFTLEHRIPLALVGRGPGLFPLALDRLSATLFTDAGVAWAMENCSAFVSGGPNPALPLCERHLVSAGGELASDLVFGYDVPVRVRAGVAAQLNDGRKVSFFAAVGAAF